MTNPMLPPGLLQRIQQVTATRPVIPTLSQGRPNRIVGVDLEGVDVETERSDTKGIGPQRVPAEMIINAWDHLAASGTLTIQEAGHRGAFICALFAQFND